jgi:hypothetical protein
MIIGENTGTAGRSTGEPCPCVGGVAQKCINQKANLYVRNAVKRIHYYKIMNTLRPVKITFQYRDAYRDYVTETRTGYFHQWAMAVDWPDGTNPVVVTKAIVESESGEIRMYDPEKIVFTDKSARDRRQTAPGMATQNNQEGGTNAPTT